MRNFAAGTEKHHEKPCQASNLEAKASSSHSELQASGCAGIRLYILSSQLCRTFSSIHRHTKGLFISNRDIAEGTSSVIVLHCDNSWIECLMSGLVF